MNQTNNIHTFNIICNDNDAMSVVDIGETAIWYMNLPGENPSSYNTNITNRSYLIPNLHKLSNKKLHNQY